MFLPVAGSVVTAPIPEELAFRGHCSAVCSPPFNQVTFQFTWISFLLSSLLFGALHGRSLLGTLADLLHAFAVCRRGRLPDAVTANATINALITPDVLITGKWNLWQ